MNIGRSQAGSGLGWVSLKLSREQEWASSYIRDAESRAIWDDPWRETWNDQSISDWYWRASRFPVESTQSICSWRSQGKCTEDEIGRGEVMWLTQGIQLVPGGGRTQTQVCTSPSPMLFVPWYPFDTWLLCHFSRVWLFIAPWTVARQALLFMGFSRQEYWSGLHCPPLRDLPNPGIEHTSLASPALQADSHLGSPSTW